MKIINEDEKEYATEGKIREILDKFCSFMPVEIYFAEAGAEESETQEPINDTTPVLGGVALSKRKG